MQSIIITSHQVQAGKTTLAVNLAAGLANKGFYTLLLDLSSNDVLKDWIFPKNNKNKLNNTNLTLQWRPNLEVVLRHKLSDFYKVNQSFMDNGDKGYNYMVVDLDLSYIDQLNKDIDINHNLKPDELMLTYGALKSSNWVIGVVLLKNLSAQILVEKSAEIQKYRPEAKRGIDLIVPSRVHPRSWEENEHGLMQLIDLFDDEIIADPIPT